LLKSICSKVYSRIHLYSKEVRYCLCEKLKVKEYHPEKMMNLIKNTNMSNDLKLTYTNLIHDLNYLVEMEKMEEMRASDRGRLDIVPVSGTLHYTTLHYTTLHTKTHFSYAT
jgi:hypothetical protein